MYNISIILYLSQTLKTDITPTINCARSSDRTVTRGDYARNTIYIIYNNVLWWKTFIESATKTNNKRTRVHKIVKRYVNVTSNYANSTNKELQKRYLYKFHVFAVSLAELSTVVLGILLLLVFY